MDIDVDVGYDSEHGFWSGFSDRIDSGEGGLFVVTHLLREIGTELRVRMKLPGMSAPVETRGVVRWTRERACTGPGMGIELQEVPSEARRVIDEIVDHRGALFYEIG
jgi:uncharacterized protein (TIGR02266 family)